MVSANAPKPSRIPAEGSGITEPFRVMSSRMRELFKLPLLLIGNSIVVDVDRKFNCSDLIRRGG